MSVRSAGPGRSVRKEQNRSRLSVREGESEPGPRVCSAASVLVDFKRADAAGIIPFLFFPFLTYFSFISSTTVFIVLAPSRASRTPSTCRRAASWLHRGGHWAPLFIGRIV